MESKTTRRRFLKAGAACAITGAIHADRLESRPPVAAPTGNVGSKPSSVGEAVAAREPQAQEWLGHPPFHKPSELPPVKLIRPDAPRVETPSVNGEYVDALVPDTCDLEERARLFVESYLVRVTIPELHYEPYDWGLYDSTPPRVALGWGDYVCGWPKFRESLPLMRMMIGCQQGMEIDQAWAEHLLKCIGPDGLFYIPLKGRPWDGYKAYPWLAGWLARYPSVEHYTYLGCVAKIGEERSSDSCGGAWLGRLEAEAKCPIDELVLRQDVTFLHPSDLTFADLMDHLVALNRPPRTTELTKMLLGADPFLDGTVILLQDVIQILNRPMTATLS